MRDVPSVKALSVESLATRSGEVGMMLAKKDNGSFEDSACRARLALLLGLAVALGLPICMAAVTGGPQSAALVATAAVSAPPAINKLQPG